MIGTIVYYWPSPSDNRAKLSRQPHAAIVAGMEGDTLNLCVMDSDGVTYVKRGIAYIEDGESKPEHGYACAIVN